MENKQLELEESVNKYLKYVVEEWIKENKQPIQESIKSQLFDNFMTGLKSLFEEYYIDIPQDKLDVVAEMEKKNKEYESKINELIEDNIKLTESAEELAKHIIISEELEDVSDVQREKIRPLVETISLETEEEYRAKIKSVKDSILSESKSAPKTKVITEIGDNDNRGVVTNPIMESYISALKIGRS
jgi:hypothetical protein